jgi:hypothetical protein
MAADQKQEAKAENLPPLAEVKAILYGRGLKNTDIKHLGYETIRKMAGF